MVEAIGVHDIIEEIGEGGTEPAGEVVDKERVLIWGGLGAVGGDDTRGWQPRRISPCLHPPQGFEGLPELKHVDRQGEVGELRPLSHQRTLRRLRPSGVLGHSLALGGFGRHGGWGEQETEDGGDAATVSKGKNREGGIKGAAALRLEKTQGRG